MLHRLKELLAFGLNVRVKIVNNAMELAVQSAFLKANTHYELLVIEKLRGMEYRHRVVGQNPEKPTPRVTAISRR